MSEQDSLPLSPTKLQHSAWKGKECKGMHVSHAHLRTCEAKIHWFPVLLHTDKHYREHDSPLFELLEQGEIGIKRQQTTLNDKTPNSWFYTDFKSKMQSYQVTHSQY